MTTTRVELPSGGWVKLADPSEIKQRARFYMVKSVLAAEAEGVTFESNNRVVQVIYRALIVDWSFDEPIPSKYTGDDPDYTWDVLSAGDHDKLAYEIGQLGVTKRLVRTLDFSVDPDPKAATAA